MRILPQQYKKERGQPVYRLLDRYAGIPLVRLASLRKFFLSPLSMPQAPKKIAVLCFGAIGDLLLASALLQGLHKTLPSTHIDVITTKANACLEPLLSPYACMHSFPLLDIKTMCQYIRQQKYDVLIDTTQWARLGALVSAFSGVKKTVGFATKGQYRHYAYDIVVPHNSTQHEIENFLDLGRVLFPHLQGSAHIQIPTVLSPQAPPLTPLDKKHAKNIFCHMWPSGVMSHAKMWTEEAWAQLSIHLATAGHRVIFTGAAQDRAHTEAFLAQHIPEVLRTQKHIISWVGEVSLNDLAYYFSQDCAVVSVNTGIMHLAALCHSPLVALHGPTNPLRWGPISPRAHTLLPPHGHSAYLNLGFEYPKNAEQVLRHLPVQTVLEALEKLHITTSL